MLCAFARNETSVNNYSCVVGLRNCVYIAACDIHLHNTWFNQSHLYYHVLCRTCALCCISERQMHIVRERLGKED